MYMYSVIDIHVCISCVCVCVSLDFNDGSSVLDFREIESVLGQNNEDTKVRNAH